MKAVQSWGIGSVRHTSGLVVAASRSRGEAGAAAEHYSPVASESAAAVSLGSAPDGELFDAPMGPSVVRWRVGLRGEEGGGGKERGERVFQFQAHGDCIMCMRRCGDYVVTTSYSGEVKLWSGDGWECLCEATAPMGAQHYLSSSETAHRFVIVGKGSDSAIAVYSIEKTKAVEDTQGPVPVMELAWSFHAHNLPSNSGGGVRSRSRVSPTQQRSGRDYRYGNVFAMAEMNPSSNEVFAVEEQEEGQGGGGGDGGRVVLHLFGAEGCLLRSRDLFEDEGCCCSIVGDGRGSVRSTLFMSRWKEGCYAVGLQGGVLVVVDAQTLQVKNSFKTGYSSRTCLWDGPHLILPSDSGRMVWWTTAGKKLHDFKVISSDYVVRLDWSRSGSALWVFCFSSLNYLEVTRDSDSGEVSMVTPAHVICSHDIACCGASFSPSGHRLASGDLGGNVWVREGNSALTTSKCSAGASVRCLAWISDHSILVGCLDGSVLLWEDAGGEGRRSDEPVMEVGKVEGSVIHMRLDGKHQRLALGTSSGTLLVYDDLQSWTGDTSGSLPPPLVSFTAHPPRPGNVDMRFGQLAKQAEIWSLCWSPCGSRIATCSEDQSTRIWDTHSWDLVTTLVGHTLAVTSVDWKEFEGGRNLIATCADDRSVRVTNGSTFDLVMVLDTRHIHGWHTLTYLSFDPQDSSPILVCTTQHGHLVAWDTSRGVGRVVTERKIHCGSIEGLTWAKSSGALATVGGDCIVHTMQIIY